MPRAYTPKRKQVHNVLSRGDGTRGCGATVGLYGSTPFERSWEARHTETHLGMGWRDMPGADRAEQKMNFYLWLHGEFPVEDFSTIQPETAARYRAAHPADARCLDLATA